MNAATETPLIGGQAMTLRDVTPADRADLLALHQRVFGAPVDAAWFDWKYRQGGGEGVGLWRQGQLIAHCGGVPRAIWHAGVRQHDLQIGDVMVAPEWRGILTRRGPFFHVSKRLYDSRLGAGRRFHAGFGFPSARHLQLAVKAGLLWHGGVMTALHWATPAGSTGLSRWRWHVSPLSPGAATFDATIDLAWERMRKAAPGLSIGERNAAYARWRYTRRPAHEHLFLQLRRPWQRQALGVAVLARATAQQPAQWLDWIGPLALMPQACTMCRAEAARAGAAGLTAWASRAVLERLADTGMAAQAEVAQIGVPTASDVPAGSVADLDWWFMGGDTDFL